MPRGEEKSKSAYQHILCACYHPHKLTNVFPFYECDLLQKGNNLSRLVSDQVFTGYCSNKDFIVVSSFIFYVFYMH